MSGVSAAGEDTRTPAKSNTALRQRRLAKEKPVVNMSYKILLALLLSVWNNLA
jgi:hypothetical protein